MCRQIDGTRDHRFKRALHANTQRDIERGTVVEKNLFSYGDSRIWKTFWAHSLGCETLVFNLQNRWQRGASVEVTQSSIIWNEAQHSYVPEDRAEQELEERLANRSDLREGHSIVSGRRVWEGDKIESLM
jgi:hypothetical protein